MLNRTSLPRPVSPHALATEMEGEGRNPLAGLRRQQLVNLVQLPTTLQGYFVFVVCLVILAFTMALHVTLSAEIMRLDEQVAGLEDEFASIERTSANMVWQISGYGALADVASKARDLGYVPVTQFKFVEKRSKLPADSSAPAGEELPIFEEFQGGPAPDGTMAPNVAPQIDPGAASPSALGAAAGLVPAVGEPGLEQILEPATGAAGGDALSAPANAAVLELAPAVGSEAGQSSAAEAHDPFNTSRLRQFWRDARAWMRARFEEPVFGAASP